MLYTKPRNEKKAAQLLREKGIEVYCPVRDIVRQWSDRRKKIQEPLFKSYIFVYLKDYKADHVAVLTTRGVVRFMWSHGKPGIVRSAEIDAIKQFLNDFKGVEMAVSFEVGEEVIIKDGLLKEQKGTVIRVKGNKAYLQIKSLGWNVVADLPVQTLDKIN